MMPIHSLNRVRAAVLSFALFAVTSVAHADSQAELKNPLNSSFSSIPNFIAGALKVMVMVALPVISLFIVYSGFLFLVAQGKPGEIEKAKKNFMFVIIGAILLLGAWVIATLISGTVTQLTNG